jgi:hypothetical protein
VVEAARRLGLAAQGDAVDVFGARLLLRAASRSGGRVARATL